MIVYVIFRSYPSFCFDIHSTEIKSWDVVAQMFAKNLPKRVWNLSATFAVHLIFEHLIKRKQSSQLTQHFCFSWRVSRQSWKVRIVTILFLTLSGPGGVKNCPLDFGFLPIWPMYGLFDTQTKDAHWFHLSLMTLGPIERQDAKHTAQPVSICTDLIYLKDLA